MEGPVLTKKFKMKHEKIFISRCWSQTLLIILGGFQPFKLWNYSKTNKIKFVPITTIT